MQNWGLYQRYECYWEISTKSGQYKFNDYTFDVHGNVTGADFRVW